MAQRQRLSDSQVLRLEQEISLKFDDIKASLHKLNGIIDGLEGNWKGIGAGAFNVKQHEINTSMVRIGNVLVKFLEGMSATRRIKDGTEDEVRAKVQSIDVHAGAPKSSLSSY